MPLGPTENGGWSILSARVSGRSRCHHYRMSRARTAKPTAFYQLQNQDNYGLRIRVHRDIVP